MPHGIDALLLDVEGVLVSGDAPLPGALEATVRLRAAGIPFRLLTNITRLSSHGLAARLEALGFSVDPEEIWNPPRLAATLLRRSPARAPVAWLPADVLADELPGVAPLTATATTPDLVLLGDTGEPWSADAEAGLRAAEAAGARVWRLARRPEPAVLGLAPSRMERLPGAPGAELLAKPSVEAFRAAAADLGLPPGATVAMVGDDLEVDVAGGRAAGLTTVLLLSGRTDAAALAASLEGPEAGRPDRNAPDLGVFIHRWLRIR